MTITAVPVAKRIWPVPAALIALSLVPVIAGAVRVTELASSPQVTVENARFVDSPVPVVLHIVGATLFCVVGAFQFPTGLRRRWLGWHRAAGRVLAVCGLVAALSGMWMTVFYPHPPNDGLLIAFRLMFGSAMALSIVASVVAVRRRDIRRHRAWMLRAYAIGIGAGTQVLTLGPWIVAFGQPQGLPRALLHAVAWVANLAFAEWLIRRRLR
ncbi:DUF2306 domain-containing protein [Micromonospora sp. CPCC 206061]|uniref:DUF2306 domain-containing protein n=1 Tax=Micromonospora sp. CPCC 206061 TaxID=3122410 RepID=UPI002FEF82D2